MTQRIAIHRTANVFGALGYLSCCIQWMLMFAVLILPFLQRDGIRSLFIPEQSQAVSVAAEVSLPPFLQAIMVVAAVIFSVAVMVYALVSIPKAIGRTGSKVTHETAKVAVQQITHRKKLTEKQKKTFMERITWSVKLLIALVPLLLLLIPTTPQFDMSQEHILIAGVFCASMTILWFGVQFLIARIGKLDIARVW